MHRHISWCIIIIALILIAACSSSDTGRFIVIRDITAELQSENAGIGDKIEIKPGFVVVAFNRIDPNKLYPELGCEVGKGTIPGNYRGNRMTTYAFSKTEELADQPLTVLEDQFSDYQITCLFVRADLMAQKPTIILSTKDGDEQKITNPNPNGVVMVNENPLNRQMYLRYSLINQQGQVIYQTDTPDKGFP